MSKYNNKYYNVYEFDGEYLLVLEKTHLEKMLKYYSDPKNQIVVGQEYIIRQISICIKLLDIILNDDLIADTIYVNVNNANRFLANKDLIILENNKANVYILDDLYKCKAESLYYNIRKNFTRTWWN